MGSEWGEVETVNVFQTFSPYCIAKKKGTPLDLSVIIISKVVASIFNVLFRPQASCFFNKKLKHQPV